MSTLAASARRLTRALPSALRTPAARMPGSHGARARMPAVQHMHARSMVSAGKLNESFVTGSSAAYVEDLHEVLCYAAAAAAAAAAATTTAIIAAAAAIATPAAATITADTTITTTPSADAAAAATPVTTKD